MSNNAQSDLFKRLVWSDQKSKTQNVQFMRVCDKEMQKIPDLEELQPENDAVCFTSHP